MVPASFPDLDRLDVEALKALVAGLQVEIASHRAEIRSRQAEMERQRQELSSEIEELRRRSDAEIERLKLVIEKLQRTMFGPKSEKAAVRIGQLELELEDLETARMEMETAAEAAMPAEAAKSKPFRKPLPEHLPREVVTHEPEQSCCPDCGGALQQFGEDVSEQRSGFRQLSR